MSRTKINGKSIFINLHQRSSTGFHSPMKVPGINALADSRNVGT